MAWRGIKTEIGIYIIHAKFWRASRAHHVVIFRTLVVGSYSCILKLHPLCWLFGETAIGSLSKLNVWLKSRLLENRSESSTEKWVYI